MNCPHCKQEVQESQAGGACPHCGLRLSPEEIVTESNRVDWRLFFALLFLPPIVTMLSAMIDPKVSWDISFVIAIVGGVGGGIACGFILSNYRQEDGFMKFLAWLFFSALMIIVCLTLCTIACNIGAKRPSLP
jgi:hypothetical protein